MPVEHQIESDSEASASRAIPASTLLEDSPALLFSSVEEYEAQGRDTVLDRHLFRWQDGRMALALGLGALGHCLSI